MDGPTDPDIKAAFHGRWMLEERIGSGSLGVVFRARNLHIDMVNAVKIMHRELVPDRLANDRLLAEVKVSVQVRHANAVAISDVGMADDGMYLVMKLVPGLTLEQMVRDQGPLLLRRIGHIGTQICGALGAAHDLKLAHGGLTPSKVIVSADGADHVTVIGFRGDTEDPQSDQRALGVVLYTLAAGRRPLHFDRPALPSNVTAPFAEVIQRMLATRPDEQFPTIREASDALQAAARDAPA